MTFQSTCQFFRQSILNRGSITKIYVPTLCAAIAVKSSNDTEDLSKKPLLVKPSALPIYETNDENQSNTIESKSPAALPYIKLVREEVWELKKIVSDTVGQTYNLFGDVKSQLNDNIDYIRKEEHFPEQVAFIAAGGLTGFLFAIRRGFFKKLLYLAIGSCGAASVVYPDEASFYLETGLEHSQRSGVILYHFLNGLTRDYAGFELPPVSDIFTPKQGNSSAKENVADKKEL